MYESNMFGILIIEQLTSKKMYIVEYDNWRFNLKLLFDVIENDEAINNESDPDSLKAHKIWLEKKMMKFMVWLYWHSHRTT